MVSLQGRKICCISIISMVSLLALIICDKYFSFTDYQPITLMQGSYIEFELGYDYFYSQAYNSHSFQNPVTDDDILQTIKVTFMPETAGLEGLILYSETEKLIHSLEVCCLIEVAGIRMQDMITAWQITLE